MTLDDALQQVRWLGQVSSLLLYGVGASALVLALVGLYAVTAHAVRQRRREIGIRMAVGARAFDVLRLILVPAARTVGVGLLAGTACTAAFDRLFTTTAAADRRRYHGCHADGDGRCGAGRQRRPRPRWRRGSIP